MAEKRITCCPHCGSDAGFVVYTDYIGVPYRRGFDGEPLENGEMYDNARSLKEHRYAFCDNCGEKICTVNKLSKQMRF